MSEVDEIDSEGNKLWDMTLDDLCLMHQTMFFENALVCLMRLKMADA